MLESFEDVLVASDEPHLAEHGRTPTRNGRLGPQAGVGRVRISTELGRGEINLTHQGLMIAESHAEPQRPIAVGGGPERDPVATSVRESADAIAPALTHVYSIRGSTALSGRDASSASKPLTENRLGKMVDQISPDGTH